MAKLLGDKIYFSYEGYKERFGDIRRPAIVRYEKIERRIGQRYSDVEEALLCTLFLDGKKETIFLDKNRSLKGTPGSLVIVEPNVIDSKNSGASAEGQGGFDMVARRFNPDSKEDWDALLKDTLIFWRMGDPLGHANLAMALYKYEWDISVVEEVLRAFSDDDRKTLLELFQSIGWSLSETKITGLDVILGDLGVLGSETFPQDIKLAAKALNITAPSLAVHQMTDTIVKQYTEMEPSVREMISKEGFLKLLSWLYDDEATLPLEEIDRYQVYVGETLRNMIIKRYFYDVKRGVAHYDSKSFRKLYESASYKYYPLMRFIYESYPFKERVEAEFFIDCLDTYEKTKEQYFQVSDGVLDWVMRKSIERRRPIELNFSQWLGSCGGGVIVNPAFTGFVDFEIQYELDDMYFEDESLEASIRDMMVRYCQQISHWEHVPVIDPVTQLPQVDPVTGLPLVEERIVYEDKWTTKDRDLISLFVDWEAAPEHLEKNTFTKEMICRDKVREKVGDYCINKYGSESPWLSQRKKDPVILMFSMPVRMRVLFNENVQMGASPGVDEDVVRKMIRSRMEELFGKELERDYDPAILQEAQTDSLFNHQGEESTVFIKKVQYYRHKTRYCAPTLAPSPNLLTGRRCAICQSDMCFVTSLEKQPEWKDYKLLHVLDIIGYKVFDDTDAGIIPVEAYNRFIGQVNKAIWFYRRLICKDCGHILFPVKDKSYYYSCLLPCCSQYNVPVYLNWCHDCKKGVIDSRDTKQCSNGWYICPDCNACCSDALFESIVTRDRLNGKIPSSRILKLIGLGHKERGMVFCSKCGSLKVQVRMESGKYETVCPKCDQQQPQQVPAQESAPPPLDDQPEITQ